MLEKGLEAMKEREKNKLKKKVGVAVGMGTAFFIIHLTATLVYRKKRQYRKFDKK